MTIDNESVSKLSDSQVFYLNVIVNGIFYFLLSVLASVLNN